MNALIYEVSDAKLKGRSLGVGFSLRGAVHRVFCGADSGMWDGFREIGEKFGPFDLTILEIGAFNELWKDIHLGPDGAVEAFEALGGGLLMPIHWGLFNLALHAWREPMERLEAIVRERGIRVFSPEPGRPEEVRDGVWAEWWKA